MPIQNQDEKFRFTTVHTLEKTLQQKSRRGSGVQ